MSIRTRAAILLFRTVEEREAFGFCLPVEEEYDLFSYADLGIELAGVERMLDP